MRTLTLASFALLFAACATKGDVNDDFSDLANYDEKSDAFSTKMKIVGTLSYGDTSDSIEYSSTPRYRAFKFDGNAGDQVDVWVRSTDGGDALAWVLDATYHVVAKNDDANDTTSDSHITVTLPDATSETHYVVFRDYNLNKAHFTVALKGTEGPGGFNSCMTDSDCVAVPRVGCCNNGYKEAVNQNEVDAYEMSFTGTCNMACPFYVIDDTRQPECNVATKRCEMVDIDKIQCGGFTVNPHKCPTGYSCKYNNVPDLPGSCVADPSTDCRSQGCAASQQCSLCWGNYACIPQGAQC
jgi:hypothetical protein